MAEQTQGVLVHCWIFFFFQIKRVVGEVYTHIDSSQDLTLGVTLRGNLGRVDLKARTGEERGFIERGCTGKNWDGHMNSL